MSTDITVTLAVITGDGFCLMGQGDMLPGQLLDASESSRSVSHRLLKDILGLVHGEWAIVRQVAFLDDDPASHPTVLYSVALPACVAIVAEGFRWASILDNSSSTDAVRRMIQLACMYERADR